MSSPYDAALDGRAGTADAKVMAAYCEAIAVGAWEPRRIWEGAQAAGLTTPQLQRVIDGGHWRVLDLLTGYQPGRRWQKRVGAALAATGPEPPADPAPQDGDPPDMLYFGWVPSGGIQVGAVALGRWFWRCPRCRRWAGAYAGAAAARTAGLGHLGGCPEVTASGRLYAVKIRFPGTRRWWWLGEEEYVVRQKYAQPGTEPAARQVAAQLAGREPGAEIQVVPL